MGDDDGTLCLHLLSDMERTDRLAKAHLGIPEHLIPFAELLEGAVNSFTLLGAKDERSMPYRDLLSTEALSTFLDRRHGILDGLEIADIPLGSTSELLALDS